MEQVISNFTWDSERETRTGISEAVYCGNKSDADLLEIIQFNLDKNTPLLLTRMTRSQWSALPENIHKELDYDEQSSTAMRNPHGPRSEAFSICIVTAGTSDVKVAKEAQRTLKFNGIYAPLFTDLGVAGLWRLMNKIEDIRQYKIVIAMAGMEGALFSVLSGLIESPVIAVPTSVGYGVSSGGNVALQSALSSCAPGIMTVNIDNGFGAANAAIKIVNQFTR